MTVSVKIDKTEETISERNYPYIGICQDVKLSNLSIVYFISPGKGIALQHELEYYTTTVFSGWAEENFEIIQEDIILRNT